MYKVLGIAVTAFLLGACGGGGTSPVPQQSNKTGSIPEKTTPQKTPLDDKKAFFLYAGKDINTTLHEDVVFRAVTDLSSDVQVNYVWKENGKVLSRSPLFIKRDLLPGIHKITLTATTENKLSQSDTVVVQVSPYVLLEHWEDTDRNNVFDKLAAYTYDTKGYKTKYISSNPSTQTVFKQDIYTYDTNGNMVVYEVDEDGDNSMDHRYQYVYDDNGFLISVKYDENMDGIVDSISLYTYTKSGEIETDELVKRIPEMYINMIKTITV